jgi:DNA sulfur modification protein DndE
MKPPVEAVRVSERGRDILIKLKRRTGIEHWNVLCRWALTESLSKGEPPEHSDSIGDSNIEIKWATFGGEYSEIYSTLIHHLHAGIEGMTISEFLRAHIERGLLLLQLREDLTDLAQRSVD